MDATSNVLSYLASVTARSLVLFAVAAAVMLALRVKSAAARHAVWTVVAGGMLLLAVLTPALPPLPLHVLHPVAAGAAQLPELPAPAASGLAAGPTELLPAPTRQFGWREAAVAVYALGVLLLLARLAFGYLFTRRLVRAATPIPRFENLYSSGWISVPLTIGRKVLLPEDWEAWEASKLHAVLAHEGAHVRRADWAIALLAGVNRCVFWFHPLAWWLERHLATLAEQACDDSALLLVESQPYAQALLEMAAAVKTAQGRLIWEAMAMAKAAEVRKRIERILDETRQIPRGVTRPRWAALLLCSVPMVWLASVAQLAPAAAQEQPATPAAMTEYLKGRRQLSPGDVNVMEQYLRANPHDLDVRSQLILYYYANGVREPRLSHILWLIENHPESAAAVFASQGVLPRDNALNSSADFERVLAAWRQAAATRQGQPQALANAARFLQSAGQFEEAEKLLIAGGALQQGIGMATDQLGKLYAAAILGATGDPRFPNLSPAFAARVRTELESSQNSFLLQVAGGTLRAVARRPEPGQPLPPGVLNLDEHPLLNSAVEFGDRLLARSPSRAAKPMIPGNVPPTTGVVVERMVSSYPAPPPGQQLSPAPSVVTKVEPEYPPLARQARISGIVKLRATIGTDGTIQNLTVVSGHPLLVPAAMEAARRWTFQRPPAEITTTLDIPFLLPSDGGAAPPQQIRVGGNVQALKLIHKVDPVYPAQARAEGIQGDVTLQVSIGEDGQVQSAQPLEGHPILAAAAQEAVRQWKYQPTLLNGQPVGVITNVVVPFELR